MRGRGYTLEEWQAIASGYGDALAFAAQLWVPGLWALTGALAAPALAALCHHFFPDRYRALQVLFAPLAGGFAGGYFYALSLKAKSCPDLAWPLCLISAPPQELANIILGSMLCVVGVYLSLPGRKIPRRFRRYDHDDPGGDSMEGDLADVDLADS